MSDISKLRIDLAEEITALIPLAPATTQRREIQRKFLRGPVPLDWLQRAAMLSGRALHAGIVLWHLDGFKQTGTVQAGPGVFREFGLDRHARYRALRALEGAGLISVARRRGAAARVTLLV